MTDWDAVHAQVVEKFRTGWDRPDPHAWDDLLEDSIELVQPLLRSVSGRDGWWEESSRTLKLLPDLRADVLGWSGADDVLFIHLRFSATLAGRPLAWDAVDLLRVTPEATAVFRESFFDSAPIALRVLRRPAAWMSWWRSGVGPFFWRRRLLRPATPRSRPRR